MSEARDAVGVSSQDFVRFPLTARENIGFGDVGRMHEEQSIRSAAEWAAAGDMLAALPQGPDAPLGR